MQTVHLHGHEVDRVVIVLDVQAHIDHAAPQDVPVLHGQSTILRSEQDEMLAVNEKAMNTEVS